MTSPIAAQPSCGLDTRCPDMPRCQLCPESPTYWRREPNSGPASGPQTAEQTTSTTERSAPE